MIAQYCAKYWCVIVCLLGRLPVEVDMVTVHLPSPVADHVSLPPPIPPRRGGTDDLDKETLFTPSLKTSQEGKPNSCRETKHPSENEDEVMMMSTHRSNKESLASKCPVSNDYEGTDLPPPPPYKSSALMSGITLQALSFTSSLCASTEIKEKWYYDYNVATVPIINVDF